MNVLIAYAEGLGFYLISPVMGCAVTCRVWQDYDEAFMWAEDNGYNVCNVCNEED